MAKSGQELKLIQWLSTEPLPTNPQKFACYIVVDIINKTYKSVYTDNQGSYLTEEVPSGTVFGSQLNTFENINIVNNDTNNFVDIINSSTTVLPIGKYSVNVSYNWNSNSTKDDIEVGLLIEGNPLGLDSTGIIHKEEAKDSSGNWNGTASLQMLPYNREFLLDVTIAGVKTIQLFLKSSNNGCKVSVWNTCVKLFRIN